MNKLLDEANTKLGNDAAVARFLKCGKPFISKVRSGEKTLSVTQAAKLAELLGRRWYDEALPALAAQARSDEDRDYWLGKLKALRKIVGAALLIAGLNAAAEIFNQNGLIGVAWAESGRNIYYTKRHKGRASRQHRGKTDFYRTPSTRHRHLFRAGLWMAPSYHQSQNQRRRRPASLRCRLGRSPLLRS